MLASHSYLVAGLRLTLLLPAGFDVIRGLPNFRDFASDGDGPAADGDVADGPASGDDATCAQASGGDPALILQWVEDLTLPSGAETL
ncbi:MAG: hypothetical protein ACI39T_04015, partial [Candidatus Cryptobacteroides sp.]